MNVQIRTFKRNQQAVFISNAISDHEMSFKSNHNIKHNFRLNWENLKHTELQPNLPVCL